MLVLGRKPGEYIMIGESIMVKVVKSDDGKLRLAIVAPMDVSIVRGEIWEQQHKESL
jgi:carbon storage regulator